MQKYKILAVCLLALCFISISGGFVKCATYVVYSNQGDTFYNGANSTSVIYYENLSVYKNMGNWDWLSHTCTPWVDISSYTYINLIAKIQNGVTMKLAILCQDWSNYYSGDCLGTGDWAAYSFKLSSIAVGSPNNLMEGIYFKTDGSNSGTIYVNYEWFSNYNAEILTVSDPIYATMVPAVGSHSYIEGQPVDITASMLANYTFLKFSFSPVSDSTSNPVWFIMPSQNVTLTTAVIPPYVNTTPSKSTDYLPIIVLLTMIALSVIFYKMGVRVLVFLTTIFGFLFSIYALSSNDIPFFPFFQLFTALVFLIIMIWGRTLNR